MSPPPRATLRVTAPNLGAPGHIIAEPTNTFDPRRSATTALTSPQPAPAWAPSLLPRSALMSAVQFRRLRPLAPLLPSATALPGRRWRHCLRPATLPALLSARLF